MSASDNRASHPRRYAILRDLDHADRDPFAVLFEVDGTTSRLRTFDGWPQDFGLRSVWGDFDVALEILARNFLCSAVGREGEPARTTT